MDLSPPMPPRPIGLSALRDLQRLITRLNATSDLQMTLQSVVDGVVEGLGFTVAVVNLVREDGRLEVVAAAGGPEVRAALLGAVGDRSDWDAALAIADHWGSLCFVPHDRYAAEADALPAWIPDVEVGSEPDAWHPLDALFAPLWAPSGELVGVLSVDLPESGRRPGADQRNLLEMYAAQAGIAVDNARLAARLRAEREALRDSEELFRLAFDGAPIGMSISDLHPERAGRYVRVNDAFCAMVGYSREQLLTMSFSDVTHLDDLPREAAALAAALNGELDSYRAEKRYIRADGTVSWAAASAAVVRASDGTALRLVVQMVDITDRKHTELRLTRQALHDPLTGLANRLLLVERLDHAIAATRRSGAPSAVLFCDLDGFKQVNDDHGHAAGDQLLIVVADRLLDQVRAVDTVARVGGDEFVVVLDDASLEAATELTNRLAKAVAAPVPYGDAHLEVTVSVGIAVISSATVDADHALREADVAMYRSKTDRRRRSQAVGAGT